MFASYGYSALPSLNGLAAAPLSFGQLAARAEASMPQLSSRTQRASPEIPLVEDRGFAIHGALNTMYSGKPSSGDMQRRVMEQRRFHDALDYQRQAKHHAERRDYSREAKEPTGTSLAGLGDPYRPQPQRQSHSVAPPAIAPYGIGNRILPDRHERHPVGGGVEAGYGIGNRAVPNRQAPKGRRQGDMAGGGDYPYFGGESHPRIPRGPATPYRPPQPRHRQEVRHDYGPPMAAPREMAPPPQVVHRQGYGAMTYPQSDPVRHVVAWT